MFSFGGSSAEDPMRTHLAREGFRPTPQFEHATAKLRKIMLSSIKQPAPRWIHVSFALCLLAASLWGADWPAYRHDTARSGRTPEPLPATLHPQWTYQARHKPRPAWPEPGRELNRQAFDYAPDVVSAGGLVFFGSSADHKVYALDAANGIERWSYFTEGPIRFAPVVADGRVFVASDDGFVRCLDRENGTLLWAFPGGPTRELMFGNEQMISRWPIRTGLAVDKGIVYFAAGMWPSEEVYLYALDGATGKIVWRQEETPTHYQRQPHPTSFAMVGVSPQGYILGNESQLFIPTGRNVPAAFARKDGRFQYYRSAPDTWGNRWGGTWNMIVRQKLLGSHGHFVPDMDIIIGEGPPDPADGLVVFEPTTGKRALEINGKYRAVADGATIFASGRGKLGAYDLDAWFGHKGWKARWESPCGRTYALIEAGDTLVAGQVDKVSLYAAKTGKLLAGLPVDGQARSLAVANGRLFVSTTSGHIVCFGKDALPHVPTHRPAIDPADIDPLAADQTAKARAEALLAATGTHEGYCLLPHAPNAAFLYQLATQSRLRIFVPEPDPNRADSLRHAMDKAGLYGPRVVVQNGDLTTLRYPTYFADLILVDGAGLADTAAPAAAEIYRVLRPCGGKLYLSVKGNNGKTIVQWLRRGGVPDTEITTGPEGILVQRGPLPKSDDWTHEYGNAARTGSSADERVKLPLRLLWFGKPGPATIISRHWQGPAPLCVNGRMFITGQHHVSAVDAYNGRMLWQREFPRAGRWSIPGKGSNVAATADNFFMATGKQCLRLDARTGKTLRTYPLPAPPGIPQDLSATFRFWCFLAVDGKQVFGSMGPGESAGQCLYALDMDSGRLQWAYPAPGPVPNNAISVTADSLYLIERIGNTDVEAARRRGLDIKAGKRLVALDRKTGAVRWTTSEKISRRTTLWFADGVLVAIGGGGLSGYAGDSGKLLYARTASFRRSAVITRGTIYVQPLAFDLHTGASRQRTDPLTGDTTTWNFVRSYGCGSMGGGPNLLAFRSGTLGFYGLNGDTGIYNFPAVRAGCCINAIPADGLLLVSPGDAGCSCSYSYQTTLALIPDSHRDNWGIFYDRLPSAPVRHAALNLGAPGDRRDKNGTLWLATPRPHTLRHRKDIAVPFRYETVPGLGPYFIPADECTIAGTDIPWVFSSGIRGIRHLELDLDILDRGLACWFTAKAPNIDGKLDDACWDGYKAYPCQVAGGSIMLRYDRQALYLGCTRPLAAGDKPRTTVDAKDGPVWQDDAFEVLLANLPDPPTPHGTTCLHMAVSPRGTRYDGKWIYEPAFRGLDIPRRDIVIDGDAADWGDGGLQVTSLPGPKGVLRAPENLDASFRLAWSPEGLLVLARITDNVLWESANTDRLYEGDSIELFMTPRIGENESFQVIMAPATRKKYRRARYRFYDRRKKTKGTKLAIQVKSSVTSDGYVMEVLLPWSNLGIKPDLGREFGLQIFVNDSDGGRIRGPQAQWHPAGHAGKNPLAYQGFRLASKPAPPIVFTRSSKPDGKGRYTAVKPYPFPLVVPLLGARKEEAAYDGRWQSAVHRTAESLQAEIAIPWKTLEEAGLDRQKLLVDLRHHGPLAASPRLYNGFEKLLLVPMNRLKPRRVDVRLLFADPDGNAPGQRVFDVTLQGRTVLSNFDIAAAAKRPDGTVIREFRGIAATKAVFVDFIPKSTSAAPDRVPVLNGVELHLQEQGKP